ncbi:putative RNA polymerase II subunit B1 CTD phosphatase RPAP2 [Sycon ciliatum]|uniref:putative RNA polymerase II subunit B1 CTD phosphatase RPAP2 n=1 Tax=Sycon ciliatum TaxID=27933 RepID=UPI0020AE4354|eukprot:scpid95047/ scgid34803/ Putative RNA polymerase II subunit B1 CTD phosphatase RPAP2; RNA polymerase II-associated protein 2
MPKRHEDIIEYRRCCESLAQKVVEEFLEDNVRPEDLKTKAKYIDRLRYADVLEERSEAQHVCGYPLCNVDLKEVKSQRYHISLADKKVYDLTQRRRYCSTECYHASLFYDRQISEAPVWARKGIEMPTIRLYREATIANPTDSSLDGGDAPISTHTATGGGSEDMFKQLDVVTHKPQGTADQALPNVVIKERNV